MAEAGGGAEKRNAQLLLWCRMDTPWPASIIALAAWHLFQRKSKIVKLPCAGFALTRRSTISMPIGSAFGECPRVDIWRRSLARPAGCQIWRGVGIICSIRAAFK